VSTVRDGVKQDQLDLLFFNTTIPT